MKGSPVRQTIIETASRLFYQNGYNLTGINEVIKEARIAKATLYHHFKSKDDLCLAYLEHRNYTFLNDIKAYALRQPAGDAQILGLFDFLSQFFKDKDFNGCWCVKTVGEIPKEKTNIREAIKNHKKSFIKLIEELTKNNYSKLKGKELKSIVRQIYMLYEGAVAESHLHQEKWPIDSARLLCSKILK